MVLLGRPETSRPLWSYIGRQCASSVWLSPGYREVKVQVVGALLQKLGRVASQGTGRWRNGRSENSLLSFRRRELGMLQSYLSEVSKKKNRRRSSLSLEPFTAKPYCDPNSIASHLRQMPVSPNIRIATNLHSSSQYLSA